MRPESKLIISCGATVGMAQRGFSIVSAIFLLVVLAALGAFMLTFSTAQHISSALDVQGARAYHAARAGIDWGAYAVLRNQPSLLAECIAGKTLAPTGLDGFAVMIKCDASAPYTEGANVPFTVYQITSTATLGATNSLGYVNRQLQVIISSH
ncbi:MAG: hypothetical protein ABI075_02240 [Burkholderiaceae bacterium]